MFNYFVHKKQQREQSKVDKQKKKEIEELPVREAEKEKMVHNYKKRVENFVLHMIDHPVVTHDVTPEVYKFRDEDPSKFLGNACIKISSFKNEKQRIEETLAQRYLHASVNDYHNHPIEFRPRDRSKDIQPEMHFQSRPNVERILRKLENSLADRNSIEKVHLDRNDPLVLALSKASVAATNAYVAKHMLPELNVKTHFKAATSLYLSLPDSLVENNTIKSRKYLAKSMNPKEFKSAQNLNYTTMQIGEKQTTKGDETEYQGTKDDAAIQLSLGNHHTNNATKKMAQTTTKLPPLKPNNIELNVNDDADAANKGQLSGSKDKNYQLDGVNPVDVSKKILLRCNIIRDKNQSLSPLRKGTGHLIGYPDKSIKEVYEEIYHKSLE